MKLTRPTARQERWMAAAARLGVAADTPWLLERNGGWKTVSLLTRCLFSALGTLIAVLMAAFCWLLQLPGPMLIAGIIAIAVAELLIARRKLFRAGIEEALEFFGVLLVVTQLINSPSIYSETAFSLCIAIGMILVGIRMLNALFITAGAVMLSFTVYSANAGPFEYQSATTMAGAFCFAIATIALAAGVRQFMRLSTDRMLDWLVVVMPISGYCWSLRYNPTGLTFSLLRDNTLAALPLAMIALFGIAALVIGLRRRRHAPVLAAMLCLGSVAYELRSITGLALELRLILWGSIALLVTLGLIVYLRKPRNGITSIEIASGPEALELLELVGVSTLTPATAAAKPEYQGAGGNFGGGGASGKY